MTAGLVSVIGTALTGIIVSIDGGIPQYLADYNRLKSEEERLCKVLDATEGVISADDVILTDIDLLHWDIGTYYPGIETELIDVNDLGTLDRNINYWLFINPEKAESKVRMIERQGYKPINYVSDGNLGRIPVCVYRLNRE